MKIPCEVIFDLFPLYQEDLCSEVTKELVEEHLKECPQCQQLLENSQSIVFEANPISETQIDEKSAKILKDVKHKMNRKTKSISILLGITSFLLIVGIASLYFSQPKAIAEEKIATIEQIQIEESNSETLSDLTNKAFGISNREEGGVNLSFDVWFTGANVLRRTINTEEGTRDVIYMNLTRSSLAYFFNNISNNQGVRGNFVIDNRTFLWDGISVTIDNQSFFWNELSGELNLNMFDRHSTNEVIAVYYLVADFNQLNEMDLEQFHEATADALLLWERE